jgi:hypothetical protein
MLPPLTGKLGLEDRWRLAILETLPVESLAALLAERERQLHEAMEELERLRRPPSS